MEKVKNSRRMSEALEKHLHSGMRDLNHAYASCSYAKERAWDYGQGVCRELANAFYDDPVKAAHELLDAKKAEAYAELPGRYVVCLHEFRVASKNTFVFTMTDLIEVRFQYQGRPFAQAYVLVYITPSADTWTVLDAEYFA